MTSTPRPASGVGLTAAQVEADLPRPCIGYAYASDGAWWFRVTAEGMEHAPSAPARRDPFEIVAFDGAAVVRWRRSSAEMGTREVVPVPPHGLTLKTLLAGHVTDTQDEWATLVGRRGTRFEVPVTARPGQLVVLEQVEEVQVDAYGNARVVATHPVKLEAVDDPSEVS